jgi:phosphopantothenoylcysteine decarboxylase / phosphopantothenate---cysteine ligase
MNSFLANKQILVGVTGGIAAYKSADLVRRLREQGAFVRVVMTENAKQFITPLTLQAVSGSPVHDDLFDVQAEAAMGHIELARWADAILIAPATADCIAKIAKGEASDLLTTICLATGAPIALAPAMNQGMWKHTQTHENVQALQKKGLYIFGPGVGDQACGEVGPGRMLEPLELVEQTAALFATGLLAGKHIMITAGPTHEAIDAVRFITNASSGKMGYALAEAAHEAGAIVTLITGPVNLQKPSRFKCIDVVSAQEMLDMVMKQISSCDVFIGTAAVSDYRCKMPFAHKVPKKEASLTLELEHTPDIIAKVALTLPRPFIVGFSAETDNVLEKARAKLRKKNLDMMVANQINEPGIGFGSDENAVTVLWKEQQRLFEKQSKQKIARELVGLMIQLIQEKGANNER